MKHRTALIALAVAAALGATAAAAHEGPGRGHRADPAQMSARIDARLTELKTALNLAPTQVAAWNAYEGAIKQQRDTMLQMRQAAPRDGDAQARADFRVAMMKQRAAGAEQINNAAKSLVAILSPTQKATFDDFRPMARFGGGPGGPHRHG